MRQRTLAGQITVFILAVLMVMLTFCGLMAEKVSAADAVKTNISGTPWYTLKFTYNEKEFVMAGDSTADVSDVLRRGGISGEPSAVSVSNDSLFSVSNESGAWKVTAKTPYGFGSDEWMKVTVGGTEYKIQVTADVSTYFGSENHNIKFDGRAMVFNANHAYTISNAHSSSNRFTSRDILYKWTITINPSLYNWNMAYVTGMSASTGHEDTIIFDKDEGTNAWFLHRAHTTGSEVYWHLDSINLSEPDYSMAGGYKIKYDGEAHELATGVGNSGPRRYRYKKDGEDWSNWQGSIPKATEVGTYQIQWYSEGPSSFYDPYFPKGSAVEPAETVTTSIVSAAATKPTVRGWSGTYDGNEHRVTRDDVEGGTVYYRTSTDSEHWSKWSKDVPSRTEAGITYVEAYTKGDEDHVDSEVTDTCQIAISKADPRATSPIAAASYGQTLSDIALVNPMGNTPGVWTWNDGAQTVGSVGPHTYKATFTPIEMTNYNVMSDVDVVVNVGKAESPVKVKEAAKVTKGGKTVDLSENVSKNGATGALSYEISGDARGCSIDGNGKLTSGESAGTVTVNVSAEEDENCLALADTPITVTITDKDLQTIAADDVTITYGDKNKSVSAEVTDPATGGGEISYAVKSGSEEYVDVDQETGKLTIKKVPADGKAYITATAAETEDFEQETIDVTVSISKADTAAALVTANDRVANGREKPLVNIEDEKLVRGKMYYALGSDAVTAPSDQAYSEEVPATSKSGIYYVWYKVLGDENHNDVDPACVTVTVSDPEEVPDASGILTYFIESEDDWNEFAEAVNKGKSFVGINVRLTNDITVSKMAGTDEHRFKGTFDGDGHTLTFNSSSDEEYVAPFRYVENAKFYNLKISGTIETSKKFAGGFAADSKGNTSFASCHSNITINSTVQGDGTHGGFVARADASSASASFTDCLFDGNITGRNTNSCGGFVGWASGNTVDLKNCLNSGEYTTGTSDCSTFSRGSKIVLQNCHYTTVYGTAQGSQTYATGNQLKGLLGDGWVVKGNEVVPGKTSVGVLIGAGTVEDPYLIREEDDWVNFVGRVNGGNNFAGKRVKLTNDISVSIMVGTDGNRFGGIFDGDGHTITVNLYGSQDYTAPFRYVRGAKFYNLKVTGAIETSAKFAGGFVGKASGNTSFTSCHSNVTIRSSVEGDGTHGGFIAIIGKIASFEDCLFDGKIQGGATTNCAGFLGWVDNAGNTASFKNCLNEGAFETVQDGSGTFSRVWDETKITFDNCYYREAYGTAQGEVTDKEGDELKALLGDGWTVSDNDKVIPKTADVPEVLNAVVSYDRVKFLGIEWIVLDADYTNGYTSEEAYEAGGQYSPGILLLSVGSQGKIASGNRKNWCKDFYNNTIGDAYKSTIIGVKADSGLNGLGVGAEDKVFFLSESEFIRYNGRANKHYMIPRVNYWWLREGYKNVGNGGYGDDAAVEDYDFGDCHARPAINLDPDKIFFMANPDYTEGGSEPKLMIESKEGIVKAAKEELKTAMDKAETTRDYVGKGYTAESKQNVTDMVEAGQECLDKDETFNTVAEAQEARKEILKAKSDVEAAVEDLTVEKYEIPGTDYTIKTGNEILVSGVDTSVSEAGGRAYTGTPMFRVLKVEDGKMLLMSEYLWAGGKGAASYDRVMFNSTEDNAWQGSQAQGWGEAFNEDILGQIEAFNVANVPASKTDKEYVPAEGQASENGLSFGESENILTTDDKVFFLSGEEALEFMKDSGDRVAKLYDEDGAGDAAIWWLRSTIKDSTDAAHIMDNGAAGARAANKGCYMRPVFWADMDGIDPDTITRSSESVEGTTRTVYNVEAVHEHDWGEVTYEWSDDYSTVTAKRICKTDEKHVEEETVETTSEVTKEATCEQKGETTYTAEFENDAFELQTKTVEDIDARGHDYWFDGMTWTESEDGEGYTAKATFICAHDEDHVEVVDAEVESETIDSTCQEAGIINYTATAEFDGDTYSEEMQKGIEVKAHNWSEPAYTWSDDGSLCVAERSCENEGCDAFETEIGEISSAVKTPATYDAKGTTSYTAVFNNAGFEEQVKDIEDIPVLEPSDAAKSAQETINALPENDEITTADKAAIERARRAYDALTEEQQGSIPEAALEKLKNAEEALAAAEKKEQEEAEKKAEEEAAEKAATEAARKAAEEEAAKQKAAAETAKKAAEEALKKAAEIEEVAKKAVEDALKKASKNADEETSNKNAEEAAKKKAAEARAKKVKTITVNAKTVNAKSLARAVKKAKGSKKYITKIILGKKVKKISKKAFAKYKKVKTIVVKTKKLKKKTVKASLKGSKIKRVKVKIGSKKVNKKYVRKYKKIFTKKVCGRKVKVSR